MLPQPWTPAVRGTHSCHAWREAFQLTAHVWSHSDLAKYTAVRSLRCSDWNQRAAEECGCSSPSPPPYPSPPPLPAGWNCLEHAWPSPWVCTCRVQQGLQGAQGHMWEHVPWSPRMYMLAHVYIRDSLEGVLRKGLGLWVLNLGLWILIQPLNLWWPVSLVSPSV